MSIEVGQRYLFSSLSGSFIGEIISINDAGYQLHQVKVVQILRPLGYAVGHVCTLCNVADNSHWTLLCGQEKPTA